MAIPLALLSDSMCRIVRCIAKQPDDCPLSQSEMGEIVIFRQLRVPIPANFHSFIDLP
jgi:hypothetical protein